MHSHLFQRFHPAHRRWPAALLLAALLALSSLPARAQDGQMTAYGRSVAGEVAGTLDGETGGELWRFYGCAGDAVTLTVEAEDFTPRVDLFGPGSDVPLAGTAARADTSTVTLAAEDLPDGGLPTNSEYLIQVDGRGRSDEGRFSLTLAGPTADEITLAPGQTVAGTVRSGRVEEWTVYGCAGDLLTLELVTGEEGTPFTPTLEVYAAADGETLAQTADPAGERAELEVELPATGVYIVAAGGAARSDRGDYRLTQVYAGSLDVEVGPSPTVEPTATPTPTAGGNKTRRGTPQPRATSRPTATPTPSIEMPGIGESAFEEYPIGDAAPLRAAVYAPEGDQILTGGYDGTVRVWDRYTRAQVVVFADFNAPVNAVAFSPDGTMVAAGAESGELLLWPEENALSANPDENLPGLVLGIQDGPIYALAFSPDGQQVASAGEDGTVWVWDVEAAQTGAADVSPAVALTGHEGPVYALAYSPDGAQLAGAGAEGLVYIWDPATGDEEMVLEGAEEALLSLTYAREGDAIVAGSEGGIVYGWDLTARDVPGYAPGTLLGHTEWGVTAAVDADDTWLLSVGRNDPTADGPAPTTARIWNARDGELAILLVGFADSVVAAAFSPDGDEMMFSDGGRLLFWPMAMIDVIQAAYGLPVGVNVPPARTAPRAPTPTLAPTPASPAATPEPTATPAPTAAAGIEFPDLTDATLDVFCTVMAERLNLRPGPGTQFNPPIRALESGEIVVGVGRTPDSSWLLVGVLDSETFEPVEAGWVSAEYLFCVGDIATLPVVEGDN